MFRYLELLLESSFEGKCILDGLSAKMRVLRNVLRGDGVHVRCLEERRCQGRNTTPFVCALIHIINEASGPEEEDRFAELCSQNQEQCQNS